MQILHKNSPVFFLVFFISVLISPSICMYDFNSMNSQSSDPCLTQVCSYSDPKTRFVRFPFLVSNESLPRSCGYPGFDLLCDTNDTLLINLPNSGLFSVREIDYIKQELWLNDPDNCLPKRLISFNNLSTFLGKSPFVPVYEQDYWLFNCTSEFFNSSNDSNMKPIGCLSGTSYGVVASTYENISGNSTMCGKIGPVKVPVGSRSEKVEYSGFGGDIRLTWDEPHECGECYQRHGSCRFKSTSSLQVECHNLPRQGLTRQVVVAIALAFAAPLALVTFCITFFAIRAVCDRTRGNHAGRGGSAQAVTPQPQAVAQGLDRSIIESYPKVVLGESRRLPKPDDKSCPVCLGEYLPMETLTTLPDCAHCFHSDCIDEWLRLNASCPVCRNSPSLCTPQSDAS